MLDKLYDAKNAATLEATMMSKQKIRRTADRLIDGKLGDTKHAITIRFKSVETIGGLSIAPKQSHVFSCNNNFANETKKKMLKITVAIRLLMLAKIEDSSQIVNNTSKRAIMLQKTEPPLRTKIATLAELATESTAPGTKFRTKSVLFRR